MSNVSDHGPSQYASGKVSGTTYTVASGDTPYSIGQRFGLSYQDIFRANNMPANAAIHPGNRLLIPGLAQEPPVKPPGGQSRLGISSPTNGSTVYARSTLVVTGNGANLRGDKVIVRIKEQSGREVARTETQLDVNNNWRATFSGGLPVNPNTTGMIEAEAVGNRMKVDVLVNFV